MTGRRPRVAVVGATGAVGQTMLKVLAERAFPASAVVAMASPRSAGQIVEFGEGGLEVVALTEDAVDGFDVALFSAGSSVSREWAPRFASAGAIVIDNSSEWRMDPDVPLVVAEVNPAELEKPPAKGIVANPNCSTMQMVVALAPVHGRAGIERIVVSTYQATSGTGRRATEELFDQSRAALEARELRPEVYPHQIAFNVLPQVEVFRDGNPYSTEEQKLRDETRKILGDAAIGISATCARVPVYNGHSQAVNVQTREPLSADACRDLLRDAAGVVVQDRPERAEYPLPIRAVGTDDVYVGRIRSDDSAPNALNVWIVADNLRKGAATNAVQLAEIALENGLLREGPA